MQLLAAILRNYEVYLRESVDVEGELERRREEERIDVVDASVRVGAVQRSDLITHRRHERPAPDAQHEREGQQRVVDAVDAVPFRLKVDPDAASHAQPPRLHDLNCSLILQPDQRQALPRVLQLRRHHWIGRERF